jgi:hypothetical protein
VPTLVLVHLRVRLFTLQHLSYFMSSEMIVSKLRGWGGFLWASQPNQPAFKIVSQSHSAEGLASADRNLSRWAANCRPLYGGQASAMPPPPPRPAALANRIESANRRLTRRLIYTRCV